MNIKEKLLKIQTELKAPKWQYNSFGKYNYRSCEDILESLKPLLKEVKATIVIDDEIVQIGDRYYVKATAILTDVEKEEYISVEAYAREDESKKGMDLAQVTGSVSSYARKYALNGLFAIDDTKDSDTTNDGKGDGAQPTSPTKKPTGKPTAPVKDKKEDEDKKVISDNSMASEKQLNFIYKLVEEKNYTDGIKTYIKTAYNKERSTDLNKKEASEIIEMLNAMK